MKLALSNSLTTARAPAAAFNPADIANLEVFLHAIPANCWQDVGMATTPAGVGDVVKGWKGSFGTTINATEATSPPTLRANGLEFDPTELLNLSSAIALGESVSAFTLYLGGRIAASVGDYYLPIGHSTTLGSMYHDGTDCYVLDDAAAGSINNATAAADEDSDTFLWRCAHDGTTTAYHVIPSTYPVLNGSLTFGAITFDTLGFPAGLGVGMGNIDHRIRLIIIIKRLIVLDSAEDNLIRGWIASNDGGTLV